MSEVSNYVRETFIKLGNLTNESTQLSDDFTDKGDFESEVRRAAIDGVIAHTIPKDVIQLLKAFEMASITTQQAARVMYIYGILAEKKH